MKFFGKIKGDKKKAEFYSTKTQIFRKYPIVPEGYYDFLGPLQTQLGDYCDFGGPMIPMCTFMDLASDRVWNSVIEIGEDKINIQLRQSYRKADMAVTGAKAMIEYLPGTSEESLNTVRESLRLSRLEKV